MKKKSILSANVPRSTFHSLRSKSGFTLIELLVVIAIIAVLASIALLSLAPAQRAGRDSRRIADFRQVQNVLQLYNTKCGFYPNQDGNISTSNCPTPASDRSDSEKSGGVAYSVWADLGDQLKTAAVLSSALPNDPTPGKSYVYAVASDAAGYLLKVELETDSSALSNDVDDQTADIDCDDDNRNYCVQIGTFTPPPLELPPGL